MSQDSLNAEKHNFRLFPQIDLHNVNPAVPKLVGNDLPSFFVRFAAGN